MNDDRAETLHHLATRWIVEGWQRGRVEIVDELHAPDFVDHDSAGRPPDCGGFKQGIAELFSAFPDFHAEIEQMVMDGATDTVAIRWTASATHRGPFLGIPASGRRMSFKGIEIIRFADGKIVERWGEWDGLDLLAQLSHEA